MTILRSYSKSEDAFVDAAYLGAMGLNAAVFDDGAYGGNLYSVLRAIALALMYWSLLSTRFRAT